MTRRKKDKPETMTITIADIRHCPHLIMTPIHFRQDGTCRCDDHDHTLMREWGYRWDREAQRWK